MILSLKQQRRICNNVDFPLFIHKYGDKNLTLFIQMNLWAQNTINVLFLTIGLY